MLHLKDGVVDGCSRNGHALIFCDDCIVNSNACPRTERERQRDFMLRSRRREYDMLTSISEYENIALAIGRLVATKQIQYGDSFGNADRVLDVLYPNGISKKQMKDALVVVRIVDKLFRVANGDQGGESAFSDITGYGILSVARRERDKLVAEM